MLSFTDAIIAGDWDATDHYSKEIGDIKICLEPLLFGQLYLAVYDKENNLLFEKVPLRPGGKGSDV